MTENKMKLEDWLDDLCVRFIVNLPTEELESVERICFQVEEAQWFYEDFIRPLDPELESLNLKNFSLKFFRHCPMFSDFSSDEHLQAFAEFLAYKTRVPVRGAIMLNERMDEVVLVKGWKKGANWSFPRGKINKDEADLDCAIREVYEETGYEMKAAGLISKEEEVESFEMDLREQNMKLFVFRGVPMDTYFEPRTRKEISKIQWWKLSDLPTLKKLKKKQDGHGGDIALSANRFYMVAPFLPRLKKFIAGQKKLDKIRQSKTAASVPVAIAEGPMLVEDYQAADKTAAAASNGGMARLLDSLRQSAEPVETTELPEVAMLGVAAKDMAAQLKNFLGVPLATSVPLTSPAPEVFSNPKANSLLALLQNKPVQPAQLPQTPVQQVIEQPKLPSSPPHPHHQPQRLSTMSPPPAFPTQDQLATVQAQQPRPPQIRSIPPPQQPAQLVPRTSNAQYHKPAPKANARHQTIAPYQRTGDPQLAQYAQVSGNQPSSIPRASNLPPPELNAQSSALLSLFKTFPTAKAPEISGDAEAPIRSSQPAASTAPAVHVVQSCEVRGDSEETVRDSNRNKLPQTSRPTNMFIPSQVSPTTELELEKAEAHKPKSDHHDKLLDLFRSPSATTASSLKPAGPTLQLPSTLVELSALPTTPGHSREPSKTDEPTYAQAPAPARKASVRLEKRTQTVMAKLQHHPVSATVHGPLNVLQFEVVARGSKGTKQAGSRMDHTKPPKRSPVKILARPASSPAVPSAQTASAATEVEAPVQHQKLASPSIETFVTPIKKPPPTPDLKAQEAPSKSFHPQILRRPAHVDDANDPSPIQPLPSPRINTIPDRHPTQPVDHKQSLLSFFTKPSPSISPPSAALASAIDPSALISPLTGPSPQEQAEAAFARLTQSVGELSHDPKPVLGPSQLPVLRTGSISNAMGHGLNSGRSSRKQTPIAKTTPADKSFLLGYLNKVLEGGR